jgi:hypothetical protein
MSPTHDLKHALATVTEADRPATDPALDLARARAAASTRTRRRFRTALGGLAVVAVLGVAAATLTDDDAPSAPTAAPSAVPSSGVQLVAETFDASPYTFDLTPEGWSVQGQRPQTVTIAPDDGSTSDHPDDFRGKLVIMLDTNPLGRGEPVELDGRTFVVRGDSDYTTVSTPTADGEPEGIVRIQYPDDAGWDEATMVRFLASVHVGPGAVPGVG